MKKKAIAKKKIVKKRKPIERHSDNAEAVAIEIQSRVRKGTKVNVGQIMKDKGYSESTSKHPDKVRRTQSYKKKMKPFVKRMETERDAALAAMKGKRGKANYSDLTRGVDTLTKNIELVSGRPTERVEKELPPKQAEKLDQLLEKNQK